MMVSDRNSMRIYTWKGWNTSLHFSRFWRTWVPKVQTDPGEHPGLWSQKVTAIRTESNSILNRIRYMVTKLYCKKKKLWSVIKIKGKTSFTSSTQHYLGLVNFSTYAHEISKLCRQSPGASSVFMFFQSHYQQVDYAKQAIQTSLHFLQQDACFG